MKFLDYIGLTKDLFEVYLTRRLVQVQHHPTFPLDIYFYGREAVHSNHWDAVTTKCRGVIVNRETGDIVARPFEKFFNFGDPNFGDPNFGMTEAAVAEKVRMCGEPVVWEKMDGFLCIGYKWDGKWYCASKGSFTSPHAKWATSKIQEYKDIWPTGYTPVFEGITPNLRIVVDYGEQERLVLLAYVETETGAEYPPTCLRWYVDTPTLRSLCWDEAVDLSRDEDIKNVEGYVLTWYQNSGPPFRLKVKYIDYLRIHRMVTGLSPKRILEALQNGWTSELDEWSDDSTPWFNKFVTKWRRVIEVEAMRLECEAKRIYDDAREENRVKVGQLPYENMGEERKAYAQVFNRPENREFSGILFAMLDGKRWQDVIYKKIKTSGLLKNSGPMVDSHYV